MSYILDALRRAERERRLGQTPTVESLARRLPEPQRRERSPLLWLLIVATLAIGAIAAALLLRSRPAPVPAVSQAAPQPIAVAPVVAPPREDPGTTATPAIEDSEAIASLDDLSPVDGDEPALDAAAAPEIPAEVRARMAAQPLRPEDTSIAVPEPPPAVPAPAPQMAAAGTAATPARVPTLREMPDAYRAQFPAITLDVHVYDAEPARRWIMVDAQRYRENDSLPSGARIARIAADGVVIDYQNSQVLIPVR